jgi:hypothetical protein
MTTWMNQKDIMVSKQSTEGQMLHDSFMGVFKIVKLPEIESRMVFTRGYG